MACVRVEFNLCWKLYVLRRLKHDRVIRVLYLFVLKMLMEAEPDFGPPQVACRRVEFNPYWH